METVHVFCSMPHCRWEAVQPTLFDAQGWAIHLISTSDIVRGEEVLSNYGALAFRQSISLLRWYVLDQHKQGSMVKHSWMPSEVHACYPECRTRSGMM